MECVPLFAIINTYRGSMQLNCVFVPESYREWADTREVTDNEAVWYVFRQIPL